MDNNTSKMPLLRKAIDSAVKSHELEGFVFTAGEKKEFEEIVCGKRTLEERRNKYLELGRSLGRKSDHA